MPIIYGPDDKPLITIADPKSERKEEKDRPSESHKGIRAHKVLLAWLLGIATLLGGAAVVLPRPTVTADEPVDPQNTLSASFTIVNTNFIPLRHVTAALGLGQLKTINGVTIQSQSWPQFDTKISFITWENHALNMDDKFTITPDQLFHGKFKDGDIEISVSYRPWFIPWTRIKAFRFRTYQQTNGNYYWYSAPTE
jgi:hypothetical protein